MEQAILSREKELELIQRFRRGDHLAFEALHKAHAQWLFLRVNRVLYNRHDAEDVVQDAFLNAWKARENFDLEANGRFGTWLLKIAKNKTIDFSRRSSTNKQKLLDVFEWGRPRTKHGTTQEPIPPQHSSATSLPDNTGLDSTTEANQVEGTVTPATYLEVSDAERFLVGLGDKERIAFTARASALESVTDADLARELGWKLGTFKTALSRARAKIKVVRDTTIGGAAAFGE